MRIILYYIIIEVADFSKIDQASGNIGLDTVDPGKTNNISESILSRDKSKQVTINDLYKSLG